MTEPISALSPLESKDSGHHSWDQAADEGSKAFASFAVYRDLGPERTVQKVVDKSTKHRSLIYRWALQHRWQNRVREWDEYQDQLIQAQSIRTREEMNRATLLMAQKIQSKAIEGLNTLQVVRVVKDAKTGEEKLELAVKPAELIRMMQAAHEVTQQLLGKADEDKVAKIELFFGAVPPEEEPPLNA